MYRNRTKWIAAVEMRFCCFPVWSVEPAGRIPSNKEMSSFFPVLVSVYAFGKLNQEKCFEIWSVRVSGEAGNSGDNNYGRLVGRFEGLAHGVRGTVYAVDDNTLYVRGFCYDGIGPSEYRENEHVDSEMNQKTKKLQNQHSYI